MSQLIDIRKPIQTLRGTWDEILAHSTEISKTSEVELRIFEPRQQMATMALMASWLAEDATDDPDELQAAEEELSEFKHNMNLPRKENGARIIYPEVE